MDFLRFLEIVPKIVDARLPAEVSHFKMAPFERVKQVLEIDLKKITPKLAAVMMLFYPKEGKTHIVLIVRNSYDGVHSGQIAFPGGKFETDDENFAHTALRETYEEIGVDIDKMDIVKSFTELYIPPSNFMVYPFLGICNEEISFYPDSNEVIKVIELPLSVLLNDEIVTKRELATSYLAKVEVPAFDIEGHIVWGATAMILSELKDVLKTAIVP